MKHANVLTTVYMTTAILPLRYEIINTGTAASSTQLKQICVSITSEGGLVLPGNEFSASSGITTVAVTTRRPIFAIRQAATFNSLPNHRTARIFSLWLRATTNDLYWELIHVHNPTAVTATWTSADSGVSSIEYSTDISAVTATMQHRILTGTQTTSQGSFSESTVHDVSVLQDHSFISQNRAANMSQMFILFGTSYSGTSNISCGAAWLETD